MGEYVAQIGLRINAVEPGAADERVHGRSALATAVSSHEQEVLASQAVSPQRIFGDVIVDFGSPVLAVIRQGLPLVEHVVDRLGRVRLRRQRQQPFTQPRFQTVQQWPCLLLPYLPLLVRRLAPDLRFDGVQFADPAQGFGRRGGRPAHMQIMNLTSRMRHARRFPDASIGIDLVVTDKGIGLQHTAELGQMRLRMLAKSLVF
jgi:hypothetical protein